MRKTKGGFPAGDPPFAERCSLRGLAFVSQFGASPLEL